MQLIEQPTDDVKAYRSEAPVCTEPSHCPHTMATAFGRLK
jgi:hypothetical protein